MSTGNSLFLYYCLLIALFSIQTTLNLLLFRVRVRIKGVNSISQNINDVSLLSGKGFRDQEDTRSPGKGTEVEASGDTLIGTVVN